MVERVDSTADARTVNNVVRHEYRVLSEDERARMKRLKGIGAEFIALLYVIGGTSAPANQRSRELAIAQVKAEEAVMWAVKHITS